jgi:hypothetical protein
MNPVHARRTIQPPPPFLPPPPIPWVFLPPPPPFLPPPRRRTTLERVVLTVFIGSMSTMVLVGVFLVVAGHVVGAAGGCGGG